MALVAFLFIGAEGESALEQWTLGGRVAAAADSLAHLLRLPGLDRVVVATNLPHLPAEHPEWSVTWDLDPSEAPFHFGTRLAALTAAFPADLHVCFGAGCAPLLEEATLAAAVAEVRAAREPWAVTNNPLSSDWIIFNCPEAVQARPERLGRDNMLGPVLRREAGVTVRGLPVSAAARADVDTPADLAALSQHPRLGPALSAYLRAQPPPPGLQARWAAASRTLHTPEARVTLIGRVAASIWGEVERRTQSWVRVFSEERGMTSSGRLAAGQVRSVVAAHLLAAGPAAFYAELAEAADVVFFDTRVALAHSGLWPPAADRYAADAGQPDLIQDAFLRALTAAAAAASIPIVLGGHGVVTGDLLALLEAGPPRPPGSE
jgi:hypothetical protein